MILLIEPNQEIANLVSLHIRQHLGIDTIWTTSIERAQNLRNKSKDQILAAILNLAYCRNSYSPFEDLPTILITGPLPLESKLMISAQHILDYVIDYSIHNIEYIIHLLKRVKFTNQLKVIIADDEPVTRNLIRNLLVNKRFQVLEAKNGDEAYNLLRIHPDTRLMIIDDDMPKLVGIELVNKIRKEYSKNQLSVIGMTAKNNEHQHVLFLRYGANDCMIKPFRLEEFDARVMQNLQLIEAFHELAELSRRDFLTNLYNRRYFFEIGKKYFENAKRDSINIFIAMIDIDHFKQINDTYGHSVGDEVITALAKTLTRSFRLTDIIARFGGEEFCIISTTKQGYAGIEMFERVREIIEKHTIETTKGTVNFTVSIGVTSTIKDSLDTMITDADQLLYKAKNNGRNCVIYE